IERIPHAELVLDRFVAALKPGGLLLVHLRDRNTAFGFLDRALPRWMHVSGRRRRRTRPGRGPRGAHARIAYTTGDGVPGSGGSASGGDAPGNGAFGNGTSANGTFGNGTSANGTERGAEHAEIAGTETPARPVTRPAVRTSPPPATYDRVA